MEQEKTSTKINLANGLWNAIVVLCATYAAIVIPFEVVFNFETDFSNVAESIITIVFTVDFAVKVYKYRVLKRNPNHQESSMSTWYLTGLIFMDLLAAIPFGIFFYPSFFRLFRLFKLFRVVNIYQAYRQGQIKLAGILTFLFYVYWILLIVHWLGCGWSAIRGFDPGYDIITNYVSAIYWTITTITTVGYGDILPVNNVQKIYAMFVQILGFGVFGFLIGTIASALMKKDPAKAKYDQNIESLASLMHYRAIPQQLKKRIIDFYIYMWKKRLGYDETAFLRSLPEHLRTEVALHLKKEVIEKISLFNNASNEFKREIALLLKPVFLTPEDYVFKAGDFGGEMYFVVDGELNVLSQKEDRILTKLGPGEYFGEIALFKNKNRSATVKAISYCDIYMLDKKAFDKVLSRYPEIAARIEQQAEIRESK